MQFITLPQTLKFAPKPKVATGQCVCFTEAKLEQLMEQKDITENIQPYEHCMHNRTRRCFFVHYSPYTDLLGIVELPGTTQWWHKFFLQGLPHVWTNVLGNLFRQVFQLSKI